jgi:uncharacterized protein involved in exopolysaccharide biosynthesis
VRRYVEAFLRHPALFGVPIVLAFLVSVMLTQQQPRAYIARASLWADAPVPNDTTILDAPNPTPAQQEMGVLQELLHTREFLGGVWSRLVKSGVEHGSPSDAQLAGVANSITVATGGAHVLTLAVKDRAPDHASATTKAAIDELIAEVAATRRTRFQQQVAFYTEQVNAARTALTAAQGQLDAYEAQHPPNPDATEPDPAIGVLASGVTTAQQHYNDASSNLSTAQQGLGTANDSTELRIVDAPVTPTAPESHKKQLLFAGVAGLFAGAVVSLLALVFLVATDTSVRTVHDLEDELAPRVIGTIPLLKTERAG